jgi:NADH-quinone oxidoreductase subunit L
MMDNIALLILLLPMVGSVAAFVLGKMSNKLAFLTAEVVSLVVFLVTLRLFYTYTQPIEMAFSWFHLADITLPFGIYIDQLSLVMLLIATGLGFLDIHFAHDYMADDPHQPRYYAKVLFFIGGMILLVSAKDMISLFMGWEFMGLASYLLISFWHQQNAPADAGMSAFLFTRFGDIFLFGAIGILFYLTGTLDLVALNTMATDGDIEKNMIYLIAVFIFIAAIGKSGQFPLFPWLMRAMEGPTTVSALIHGATMVNSGIYIVARLFDFYVASEALIVVAAFGAISAFIGATSALVQSELKKVLAYSTMSHLSLAFIGLGAGSLAAGMTHLVNHAVFKALLFLGSGAVIMSASHVKDMWHFGGYSKKMIFVSLAMAFGAMSLSGVPPFSGFYSKDAIIATTLSNPQTSGIIASLTLIAGILSIAYISRLWFLTFKGENRDEQLLKKVKTPSHFYITLPLMIMAIVTLLMGFVQEDIIQLVSGVYEQEPHIDGLVVGILSSITILALLSYYYYVKRIDLLKKIAAQPLMRSLHKVLLNGYFVEFFIHYFIKNVVVQGVAKMIYFIDTNIIDPLVNGSKDGAYKIKKMVMKTHSGYISDNSGGMIFGVIILLVALLIGGVM